MYDRSIQSLVGIAVITLLALVIAISGTGLFTLHLGRPVTVQLGLDLQGGARILLQAMPTPGQALDDETMEATRRIIESRVNGGLGVAEPVIQTVTSGDKRFISVELLGLKKNLQNVESVLQKTGQLTLVALDATPLPRGASTHGHRVLARGTDIDGTKVAMGTDAVGAPAVDVTVRGPAAAQIAEYTAAHVGGYMGIALDNKIYDSPQIQSPLGGQFQITNVGSLDNAKNLAITLKYGALPVPLQVAGVQEVSATLGPEHVRASLLAGAVGLVIVMFFMAIHYRVPGLLADAALLIYALVVFALFKLIPVTLTLPGIAGFILSIGMAVDANILIFERLKEELGLGRTLGAALETGFGRAWPSIRDSNSTTMLTCAILWWFGSTFAASIIVGFATTLFIGVAISMLTAVLVSRTFLRLLLADAQPTRRALFGAGR
ncbi:MAG TPA: protein translocase subunit SecD [Chloroflexota bacterium]|nr:protein translocase subunit SecD [Chloroflexota bacterium]